MNPRISKRHLVLSAVFCFCTLISYAHTGKDGAEVISSSGVIFNRYDRLASTAAAGSFSITVNNIANLAASAIPGAANNPYVTNALSVGDLLMIIKMQGATINATNSTSYGNITAYNNTGLYELVAVDAISGNTITLTNALASSFVVSATQRVQVVRIPRLSSLTINPGASLTGQAWGSSYTGGIVAIEVTGNAIINGSIDASGLGFRGGAIDANSVLPGVSLFLSTVSAEGGEKGESIAGYQADYDALGGRYCKGAPANAGGGGTAHNGGGGGGANGGNPATWDGKGNPDLSGTNWNLAWDLEGASFSTHTSSGGGRGGYSFHNRDRDALTVGPGNSLWNGDDRRIEGGFGGRPLTYASNTLFMGGGGGAGDQNQGFGTPGGNGGGIIYLTITGTLSGTGSVSANGNTASTSTGIDAAGGGGGGGAVKLNVLGAISGISVFARGGNGGSQIRSIITDEAEGPGGGGGGGYIAVTGSPAIILNATGGVNGTTNSSGVTEFTADGATMGAGGGNAIVTYDPPPPYIYLAATVINFNFKEVTENKLLVSWTISNETGFIKYELEQKIGNQDWVIVTSVPVQKTLNALNNYSFPVNQPRENTLYRLKCFDWSGLANYSNIKVYKPGGLADIKFLQTTSQVIADNLPIQSRIYLYNGMGQNVKLSAEGSASFVKVDKTNLTNGIYYLCIYTPQGQMSYRFRKY